MSTGKADVTIPPPVKALGGWVDAAWFCPSVLSDDDVVGFRFPPLAGVKKQTFQVVDRSRADQAPAAARPPKRVAGKLFGLLDGYGVTGAVACCRSRFLFESKPVLFFATMPLAKLKARSANKLRRELIEIDVRGCVLRIEAKSVIAMFWPAAEVAITDFVRAATPDHAMHADFDRASSSGPAPENATASEREKKLLREVAVLRQQVEALQQSQSVIGAMEKLGLDDGRLKSMLTLLHPDKHGGSEAANEAAKWVNSLRDVLRRKGESK